MSPLALRILAAALDERDRPSCCASARPPRRPRVAPATIGRAELSPRRTIRTWSNDDPAGLGGELLDRDHVFGGNLVLLAAGLDDCEHRSCPRVQSGSARFPRSKRCERPSSYAVTRRGSWARPRPGPKPGRVQHETARKPGSRARSGLATRASPRCQPIAAQRTFKAAGPGRFSPRPRERFWRLWNQNAHAICPADHRGSRPAARGFCPDPHLGSRRGGRVVECTALEMRHGCKPIGSSNLPLSAINSLFVGVSAK